MHHLNNVKRIFHVSDIHIRNFHRHQEFKEVFEKMFQKFDELIIPNETVIFLGGDIAHSKNEISPELVSLITYLFRECTKRCPTILIPGNHDANLANAYRMDVLTPIVESMNDPNLHYWKETGVYELGDIAFSHYSVFGNIRNWIPANKMVTDKDFKICLHHGAVHGAITDLDYNIENEAVTNKKFDNFDIVMLGDIHCKQVLQLYSEKNGKKKPIICYSGAILQNNHGEKLDQGFICWDVRERTPTFIPIENNYGFYTAYLLDDKHLNPTPNLPKNLRLRIFYENCTKDYINKILTSLKRKHKILDVVTKDQKPKSIFNVDGSHLLHSNSRDIEYQNQMLKLFFENEDIIDIDLDFIRHYNRTLNSKLQTDLNVIRNEKWKPKYLKFSNTFSYGEDNLITFENLNGVVGLFAKNAEGKSSALDSFVFTLFDKYTRGFKSTNVMNYKKDEFSTEFCFEMEGKEFYIYRVGIKNQKTKQVRVEVTFKSIENDIEIDLTGKDRDDTNKKIREYLGTYEDFMTTIFTSQNAPRSFSDMTLSDRNDLFCRFLDIQIYNDLFQIAKEDNKDAIYKIKELEKREIDTKLPTLYEKKTEVETYISNYTNTIDGLKNDNKILQDEIITLSTSLQNNEIDINIDECNEDLIKTEQELAEEINQIKKIKNEISESEKKVIIIEQQLSKFNETHLKTVHTKQLETQKKLQKLYIDITKINSDIKNRNEKVEHLKDHEYDPNCKYCIQNKFVVDAKKAEQELVGLNENKNNLNLEIDNCKEELNKIQEDITKYEEFNVIKSQKIELDSNLKVFKNQMESKMYRGKILQNKISDIRDKINVYYENENLIQKNLKIKEQIIELKSQSNILSADIDTQMDKLIKLKGLLTKTEYEIADFETSLVQLKTLRHESSNYEYYCRAMSKDGIPYLILNDALPLIENEVNSILGQIVEFTIKLEMTEKNNISAYIVYDMEQSWAIEMTSGMEKFILSMAFRVGLMNITTLPSTNFMLIDEGFGVLDSTKLNDVYLIFDYLKSKFDFILCVSHIDAMKDMVDNAITLEKVNRVSRIRC